ncbi:MAG: DegT/DnrJ/EryC1/StrS family aminotransferase [Candidatus Kryptoniota bacterium]
MRVPLLDLKAQYAAHKKELDQAILRVVESQHFILGPEVENLEKKLCSYLGSKYAIGVSSGTDALLIALMAIGIKPGDEIIVPTFSFFATAGVVARMNAIPVFTDIDPVTFNIDPDDVLRKVSRRTRAIIPVHLYGQSADMEPIVEIAHKYSLKVIEDGAQAIGAQYKDGRCVGTIGDIGCFSFFPSKNLGGYGDGGLVVTNDDDLAERLMIMRVHGGKPKYFHKVIGGNFRLDAIQAAVLNVKLTYLDDWSNRRRKNSEIYSRLFINAGLAEKEGVIEFSNGNKVLLPEPVYKYSGHKNYHIYNQYVIRVQKRDQLKEYLAQNEIGTEIYYPVPFHRQECFSYLNNSDEDFPHSNFAAEHSLALPIFPELNEDQIEWVVRKISEFVSSNN